MMNLNRTTRVSIRCQPAERDRIARVADHYGLTTAEFLRQAVIIATARQEGKLSWRRTLVVAMAATSEDQIWSTS